MFSKNIEPSPVRKQGEKSCIKRLYRDENSLKIAGRISLMLLKPSLRETKMENCCNHPLLKHPRSRSFGALRAISARLNRIPVTIRESGQH